MFVSQLCSLRGRCLLLSPAFQRALEGLKLCWEDGQLCTVRLHTLWQVCQAFGNGCEGLCARREGAARAARAPTLAVVTGAGRSAEAVLAVRCLSVKIFTSFYFPLYTFEVICPFLSVGIEKVTS